MRYETTRDRLYRKLNPLRWLSRRLPTMNLIRPAEIGDEYVPEPLGPVRDLVPEVYESALPEMTYDSSYEMPTVDCQLETPRSDMPSPFGLPAEISPSPLEEIARAVREIQRLEEAPALDVPTLDVPPAPPEPANGLDALVGGADLFPSPFGP